MRNKFLKKSSANVLNILLLFSLVWPNIFSPALVIAEEIDIPVENTEIPIDTSEDILENGISTSIFENGIYTIPKVEEIEYVYPENENVRIKFTSVTEEGNLEIKKVLLSEEQRLELNTSEEYAWDFTSTMSNGSFTYDLVLPNTQGNDVEIKYTEDGTSYTALENSLVNEGYITISGLDHFTMFVVTTSIPGGVVEGTTEVDETCNVSIGSGMYCYDDIQEAINNANDGNTISVLAGTYEVTNSILVNKEVSILAENGTKVINIDTPAKSVFSITRSNVRIENFEITHQNSFPLDHNEIANALISIPDNANLTNVQIRNNTIYGNYTSGTLHKDMYTRGITIGSSGITTFDISNNTISSVRNGIAIRQNNTGTIDQNIIFNTKGGVMNYTSSFADADNRVITNNNWTDIHNEWDIVWNSATYGFPDYQNSVITLSVNNNNAYVLDLRRDTTTEVKTLSGNRTPVFVTKTGSDIVHQSTGNFNEPLASIQFAIEKVAHNGKIYVKNGEYEEQVLLSNKNVSIIGESEGNTKIISPASIVTTFENLKPVISTSFAKLDLENITIDGLGRGNANYRMVGIGLQNSFANLNNVTIVNIKETPANGNQHGVGMYVYNSDGIERIVSLESLTVHDYQKNGFVFRGQGLVANITNSLVAGLGDIDFIAQNGIQYGEGATGTIQNNEVYGNLYTPQSWSATGILLYNAGNDLKIQNNNIHNNGWGGIYISGSGNNLQVLDNHIHDNLGDGLIFQSGSYENSLVKGNTIENNDNGIWMDTGISPTLLVTENFFNNTELNASDEGSYFLDNGLKGNYWSDYTGFDLNGDGIGEPPYQIDSDSSDRYPLTEQYLSAKVNNVKANTDYYKKGDILSVEVEVTNNGNIPLDPTKENLVINITRPNGTYISGTFRGKVLLDLQPGETRLIQFYSTEQAIPEDWVDGTYTIHTSIYSQRTTPLNYLVGGQNSSETFIVDSTKPSTPVVFGYKDPNTSCGGFTTNKVTTVDWSDSSDTGSSIKGYQYQINYPTTNSSRGLWTTFFTNSEYRGSLNEGSHYIRVRAQDLAGNWSDWSQEWTNPSNLTSLEKQQNCSITLDTIVPQAPTNLYFWDVDNAKAVQCGGYSNTRHINEHWDPSSDVNLSHYEYSSFNAPNGVAGLVNKVLLTNYFDSSWWNIPKEGTYGFQVRTVDLAGNTSPFALTNEYGFENSCKITIDWTAPYVEITNPSNNQYVKGSVDFRGTVQDTNLYRYYYSIQNTKSDTLYPSESFEDLSIYQWNTTEKPDGIYELRLEARDLANNKDNNISVESIKVTVDNTLPTVSLIDDFTILEGSTIPTKEVLVKDNYEISQLCYSITSDIGDISERCISPSTSTNEWNLDFTNTILTLLNTEFGITTIVADTSILPEGEYSISYYSEDMAGNKSVEEETVVTISNVLPNLIFSSDKTTLVEGNNVIFNGQFTDPGQDDKDWSYRLSFGDLTADILGTTSTNGNIIINTSHTYNTPGTYTAQLEICEQGGLCTTSNILITVNPLIVESGEVAGVTTTTKPKTILKTLTTVVTDILGIGGDEDEKPEEESDLLDENTSEVKGSQTCDNPSKISGYIYQDKDENGKMDEKEKRYSDISVRIYTKIDEKEETIKNIKTDDNGYWETTLCSGRYFVEADKGNLPNNFDIQENVLGIDVQAEEDTTLDFTVTDERNFLQKYWLWLLVALTLVGGIGILVSDSKKKKSYA